MWRDHARKLPHIILIWLIVFQLYMILQNTPTEKPIDDKMRPNYISDIQARALESTDTVDEPH